MLPAVTWTALATVVAWMIYGPLMLRFKGATLGKMALGISVRFRERPGRMPWSAIVVRLLVQQGVLTRRPSSTHSLRRISGGSTQPAS